MAKVEHVRAVCEGRDGISEWRRNHPNDRLELDGANLGTADLRAADLRGASLIRAFLNGVNAHGADLQDADLRFAVMNANFEAANFRGANLGGAYLRGATLERADLRVRDLGSANMSGANLVNADLSGADLISANLDSADLAGANLRGARLFGANLTLADLSDSDLSGAILGNTVFGNVDLSRTRGLDSAVHRRGSTLGIDTLFLSRGKIPDSFLRGCGIPEDVIAYIPSLIGQAFDFYSCFISYGGTDQDFVARLYARLQQEKLRVWYAPEDMHGGRKSYDQIDAAIRIHDKLLLVLSPASMGSEWVKLEVRTAIDAGKQQGRQKLFPIRICDYSTIEKWKCLDADGNDCAVEVRRFHLPDFSNWKDHDSFEAAFKGLLSDLRKDEPALRTTGGK